jgi:hypothetical protein
MKNYGLFQIHQSEQKPAGAGESGEGGEQVKLDIFLAARLSGRAAFFGGGDGRG